MHRDRRERKSHPERPPEPEGPPPDRSYSARPPEPPYPPRYPPRGRGWVGPIPRSDHPRWKQSENNGIVKRAKQERFNHKKKERQAPLTVAHRLEVNVPEFQNDMVGRNRRTLLNPADWAWEKSTPIWKRAPRRSSRNRALDIGLFVMSAVCSVTSQNSSGSRAAAGSRKALSLGKTFS